MARQLTPEQKAEAAKEELRTLIREAHEAAQGLRETIKAAEQAFVAGLEAIDRACKDQIQPQVDAFASDASAMLTRFCNRAIDAFGESLEKQLKLWDQDIRRQYVLPPGPDLVFDLRGETPLLMDGQSEQARQTLANAPFAVMVNPTPPE